MNALDFVPAISEHPEDDAPRLVCADWFEENGQSERAEFIRAQVQLAHVGGEDEQRRRLGERARELLAAHEEEWAGPLLNLVNKVGFRRGFVERVTLTTTDFLDDAGELFSLAPIREAVFVKTGPGLVRLADCPHLARLRLLDFRDSNFSSEDLADFLVSSPYLGGLRAFVFRLGKNIGSAVVEGLLHAKQPPPLETLDLYDAGVTNPALDSFASWPGATTLRTLVLGGNDLGEMGAIPLNRSPHLSGLRTLHLGSAALGDRSAEALAHAPHLAGLERLDLRHNPITDESAGLLRDRFGDRVLLGDNL